MHSDLHQLVQSQAYYQSAEEEGGGRAHRWEAGGSADCDKK